MDGGDGGGRGAVVTEVLRGVVVVVVVDRDFVVVVGLEGSLNLNCRNCSSKAFF